MSLPTYEIISCLYKLSSLEIKLHFNFYRLEKFVSMGLIIKITSTKWKEKQQKLCYEFVNFKLYWSSLLINVVIYEHYKSLLFIWEKNKKYQKVWKSS